MMRDLKDNIDTVPSIHPGAKTASANGAGVDLQGYDAAMCLLAVGAWTDGTHTLKLQESDDNSVFSDVAAADLQGAFTVISGAGQQNAVQRVGYIGSKRYIRAATTVAGATTGAIYGAAIVRGSARLMPLA
jgi:hypothetical protein